MVLELWTNDRDIVVCEDGDVLGAYDAEYGLDDYLMQRITAQIEKGEWSRMHDCTMTFEKRPKGIPRTASVRKIKEDSDDHGDAYECGHRVAITMSAQQWASWKGIGVLGTVVD